MIPQSFKDILSNGEYTGLLQSAALVIFLVIFLALAAYVFTRPKKHYREQEMAPLDDEINFDNHSLK